MKPLFFSLGGWKTLIVRFGAFSLDTEGYVLSKGEEPVSLDPQGFNLLSYLLENRERVVSKDELIEHVWEGRIVSDAAITSTINLVRRAVEDDGKTQAIIKTFPRRGFRFVSEIDEDGDQHGQEVGSPVPTPIFDKPSIAVLPFENMSGDPEQEYFSDGITEDIITALSRLRWILVTARNTTFSYKGQSPDIREMARDLAVRYVLEGSVRKVGNQVRISVQLVDGLSGTHVWAERYDRELNDIFAVQDEITETVLGAIQPELTQAEIKRARAKSPESLDAWDLYQRGLWHLYRGNKEDNAAAIDLFFKAIEFDSEFVSPYVGLVECYGLDITMGFSERDPADAFAPARTAVEIDPQNAKAHAALGVAHFLNRDNASAVAEYNKSLALNPNDGQLYGWLGFAWTFSGAPENGLDSFRTGIKLSPRDPSLGWLHNGMAAAYFCLRRHKECVEWARKAIQFPNDPWLIRAYLVSALSHLEREEECKNELADLLKLRPDCTITLVQRLNISNVDADRTHLVDGLRNAGMPED